MSCNINAYSQISKLCIDIPIHSMSRGAFIDCFSNGLQKREEISIEISKYIIKHLPEIDFNKSYFYFINDEIVKNSIDSFAYDCFLKKGKLLNISVVISKKTNSKILLKYKDNGSGFFFNYASTGCIKPNKSEKIRLILKITNDEAPNSLNRTISRIYAKTAQGELPVSEPGISPKGDISLGGAGMGLLCIVEYFEKLSGTVYVKNRKGNGCCLSVTFPSKNQNA